MQIAVLPVQDERRTRPLSLPLHHIIIWKTALHRLFCKPNFIHKHIFSTRNTIIWLFYAFQLFFVCWLLVYLTNSLYISSPSLKFENERDRKNEAPTFTISTGNSNTRIEKKYDILCEFNFKSHCMQFHTLLHCFSASLWVFSNWKVKTAVCSEEFCGVYVWVSKCQCHESI